MKISLIIPVFNEAETLPLLMQALTPVLAQVGADYEVIFVNDGSTDASLSVLDELAENDAHVKVAGFPRNFGHQTAISAGLDFAGGDAVIIMDADLQDPPELIPRMVELYREGYDVVSPRRTARRGEGALKRASAHLFYWFMRRMVDKRLLAEVGDFRLLSRRAVTAIRQFREQHRFMRGMIAWLGLAEVILPFERQPRAAGATKYPLWKMLRFSWTAVSSFSALPLRLSVLIGFGASAAGVLYFLYVLYAVLFFPPNLRPTNITHGWTTLVALQVFFFGATLLSLGLVGDYIARIYEESKGRPLYVVNHTANLDARAAVARAIIIPEASPPQGAPAAAAAARGELPEAKK